MLKGPSSWVRFREGRASARPEGRISPYLAEIVALDHLEALDAHAYARFETVDSAIYRDRDSGRRVWLVLCDDAQPSHLERAVVVEIDAETGTVVRLRPPGGVGIAAEGVR